jgi:RNAse (barnase) inhibitor barstar
VSAAGFMLSSRSLEERVRSPTARGFFSADDASEFAFRLEVGEASSGLLDRVSREKRGLDLEEAELAIYDVRGLRIGTYDLGTPTLALDSEAAESRLVVSTAPFYAPDPLSGRIWYRWQRELPTHMHTWQGLSTAGRTAWLEVALHHHGARQEVRVGRESGQVYELAGSRVEDSLSFYCALGEAINGPGGYFGRGLDSLADCLSGGFGVTPPLTLAVIDHDHVKRALGVSYFNELADVLTCRGVRILLR